MASTRQWSAKVQFWRCPGEQTANGSNTRVFCGQAGISELSFNFLARE